MARATPRLDVVRAGVRLVVPRVTERGGVAVRETTPDDAVREITDWAGVAVVVVRPTTVAVPRADVEPRAVLPEDALGVVERIAVFDAESDF